MHVALRAVRTAASTLDDISQNEAVEIEIVVVGRTGPIGEPPS